MDLTSALFLIFPSAALAAGAFLLLRGMARLGESPRMLSGKASSPSRMKEPLHGERCAYFRIVLERYAGGAHPWRRLSSMEGRAELAVGDALIVPDAADFRLRPRISEGFVRREPGLLEQAGLGEPLRMMRGVVMANPLSHDQYEGKFLDDGLVSALRSLGPIGKNLGENEKRPLRVTEYVLPEGAVVSVCGGAQTGGRLRGSIDRRIIISDSGADDIRSALRERAAAAIAAGAFLIVLSGLLYYLIAASA